MESTKYKNKKEKLKEASVQAYLEISEIRDNIIVLKDGSIRAVLMVSSINFDLKSSTEQEALILSYQDFLNSFDFPIQILIRSKKLNLDSYLHMLSERKNAETNEFLKIQLDQYVAFIKGLLEISNIMDKKFYIVVPFFAETIQEKVGFFQKIGSSLNPTWAIKKKEEEFQLHKTQLLERVDLVVSALDGLGLRAAQLATIDIIELFYEIYNLETAQRERLVDVDAITSDVVQ